MPKEEISFQKVLEALLDDSEPFPPLYLYQFSDIEPRHLEALLAAWPRVSPTRKQSLLEDLENLAEADTLLSFEDLARSLLSDTEPQVRVLAIRLLWQWEDAKLAPVLLDMLNKDASPLVRAAAATALGQFIYLGEIEEIPERTLHKVEDNLLAAAQAADDTLVRRRALEALGFSSCPELPPLIEAAYARKEPDWVISALFAMGRSANERWQKPVMARLGDENPDVRFEAVRAAGELALKAARIPLMDALEEEEDADIRAAMIWSLSQIGGEGVEDLLEDLLDQTADEEEADLLEEALDNLEFTEGLASFEMFDFDADEDNEGD